MLCVAGVSWVSHNSVLYGNLQPAASILSISLSTPPGAWEKINELYRTEPFTPVPVFMMRTCHGLAPVGASYAYLVREWVARLALRVGAQ